MKVNVNGHIDINDVNSDSFREENVIFDIPFVYDTSI